MRSPSGLVRLFVLALLPGLGACASGQTGFPEQTANPSPPVTVAVQNSPPSEEQADTRTMLAIVGPETNAAEMTALDARLRQILAATGYRIVPPPRHVPPGQDIYFISAEISPSGIDWIVADADGDPLGKISQRRIANAAASGNENIILLGAAAAADGIHQIIRRQS